MLNLDILCFESSVDPDLSASTLCVTEFNVMNGFMQRYMSHYTERNAIGHGCLPILQPLINLRNIMT